MLQYIYELEKYLIRKDRKNILVLSLNTISNDSYILRQIEI